MNLITEIDDALPDINGDAEQLRQVFFNLILNAADAMSRQGNITVTCLGTDFSGKRIQESSDEATHVEIRIKDEGPHP